MTDRALDVARETIADLGHEATTTLTHGDLHPGNVHQDTTGHWRALDPDPRVGTIAYESHTVIVERSQLGRLSSAGADELHRRLELFSDIAGVELRWSERLCQARAVSSALYEHARDVPLAEQLCWMSELLAR